MTSDTIAPYVIAGRTRSGDRLVGTDETAAIVRALRERDAADQLVVLRGALAHVPVLTEALAVLGSAVVLAGAEVSDNDLATIVERSGASAVLDQLSAPDASQGEPIEVLDAMYGWFAVPGVPRQDVEAGAIVFTTSGTTGDAKLVLRSPQSLDREAAAVHGAFVDQGLWAEGAVLVTSSLAHLYGFVLGLVIARRTRARLVCTTGTPSARRLQEIAKDHAARVLVAVPAQYARWSERPADLAADLLATCVSAGSRLESQTVDAFHSTWHRSISNHYGSSETGSIACAFDNAGDGAVGLPYPGVELSSAADVFTVHTPWWAVVDGVPSPSVQIDDKIRDTADGQLQVVGRRSDNVKVHGELVNILRVETFVRSLPTVHDAVVRAEPAPHGDHTLVAFVVPVEAATAASIAEQCRRTLRTAEVPQRWVVLNAVPRDANGKVALGKLMDRGPA